MQYAVVRNTRREATPGATGICPQCEGDVIARCGDINVWHWAHVSRRDCDPWSEGEGEWHLLWKRRFPKQWREVAIGHHRADVKSPQGVIELQASSISTDDIAERECFYANMVWLIDASDFNLHVRDRGEYVTFRWKHPRKTWWYASKPVFFDLGSQLLKVHRLHRNIPCGGSGKLIGYDEFVSIFSRPRAGEQLCDDCRMPFAKRQLIETGMYEYCTMDLDPATVLCMDCYEARRESNIPNDVRLFDCYTPLQVVRSIR